MALLKKLLCVVVILFCTVSYAEEYTIHKIRVNGLQRISLATVLSYLPVREGDVIDSSQTVYIIRELYKTNFFSDVSLKRSGNDLVITVVEREVIGSIEVVGNNKITKKQLNEALKKLGVFEGQALDQALLNGVVQALIQQYYNMGLYDVKISTQIKKQNRNRVALTIKIKEGPLATIQSIHIIGNKLVGEKTLIRQMSLTTSRIWGFFTHGDQYSKEKLEADLEKLRAYYMDRGYLRFKVNSTKVTITPDKKHIYIVINISEGKPYTIKGFSLEGTLIGKRAEILKLITLKPGKAFSRQEIVDIQTNISQFVSDYGYGMSDVRAEPTVDDEHQQISIKFMVDAGRRIYIHRINFSGNTKTHDEVLRREMRQQEGSLFSLSKINESKRRLSNLMYLQDVDYKVTPVPDEPDQVDLTYSVKEASSVMADIHGGYSDADGILYGANISDKNFLGTGKSVSIQFDNGKSTQNYGFNYYNPYFTANAVSLSFNGYLQKVNQSKRKEGSRYSTDTYGGLAVFGIPLSDYDDVSFGGGIEYIKIYTPALDVSDNVQNFINDYGPIYTQFKLIAGWHHTNFDQVPFVTKGFGQSIDLEGYGPVNQHSLEFYRINYNASWYQPLIKDFIFHAKAVVGYGDGFGKTDKLPFFKNFFGGGINSVRGFDDGTLGIGDRDCRDQLGHATGGNVITTASASLIIPVPMKDTIRPSVFIDVGNVYNNKFNFGSLRASCGAQIEWRTPLGVPVIFSYALPLRDKNGDHLHAPQFSVAFST